MQQTVPQRFERALITGATSGIGFAFAQVLPPSTHLLLTGRNEARLSAIGSELGTRTGRVAWLAADLASAEGRTAVIKQASEQQIDLLVCNAGLGWSGTFLDSALSELRDTLAVNVLAVMELVHALTPQMLERARLTQRRAGVIIVSSTAAFAQAPAGLACYCASKAFVQRLAEALASELSAERVDVLALCPTYTATDFFSRAGLPTPQGAMAPQDVALEGLAALGRGAVHLCGTDRHSQKFRRLRAYNPALERALGLPRRIARRLLRSKSGH